MDLQILCLSNMFDKSVPKFRDRLCHMLGVFVPKAW